MVRKIRRKIATTRSLRVFLRLKEYRQKPPFSPLTRAKRISPELRKIREIVAKKPRQNKFPFKIATSDAMAVVRAVYKIELGRTKDKKIAWEAAEAAFRRLPKETQELLARFMRGLKPEEVKEREDLPHRVRATKDALRKAKSVRGKSGGFEQKKR